MFQTAKKTIVTIAALGALALGGSALAGAASTKSTSKSSSSAARSAQAQRPAGPHVGANGQTEQLLTGDTADKVTAAAKAKVPGGTIERVETDVDYGSPYEAHVRKSDGSEVTVLVNKDFEVTAVKTGPSGPPRGQGAPAA